MGEASGSEKIEEFFLILNGNGILRINDEEIAVKQGDFIAKPAGKNIAHQFINNGSETLQILDCGLKENDETITYPDEGVVLLKKEKFVFRISDAIKDWSSNPNL